jgi:hypothetical protein
MNRAKDELSYSPGKYASNFDRPPPKYVGPLVVGKRIRGTEPLKPDGINWFGNRVPSHPERP